MERMKIIQYKQIINDTQIIDIRDAEYFIGWKNANGISGHIPKALDFSHSWLDYIKDKKSLENELARRDIKVNKPTVLYTDDNVTLKEYQKFKKAGFTDLYCLEGGINEYVKTNSKLDRLSGYQKYVSPRWVESLLNGENPESYGGEDFVIVEISLPNEKGEYESGHIKGAINIDTDSINHIAGPRLIPLYKDIQVEEQQKLWGIPGDDKIQATLENLGIHKDTLVILYATEIATTGANRTAFVMDYAGVKNIKLINGGKKLWKLEDRNLEVKINKTKPRKLGCTVPQNPDILIKYERELDLIEDDKAVIASVRSFEEYLGNTSGYSYILEAGDIKKSRFAYSGSDPYAMEDYRNVDNTLFNYEICQKRWQKWGITKDKMISFHCGTGWRATEVFYIAQACGYPQLGVYAGGWYQWTKMPNSPTKEKGLPTDAPESTPLQFFN